MKTQIQSIFALTLFISSNVVGVYSVSANMSLVQPRVNQIQSADLGLPSGVSEPKGIFGTIIANLFDSSAKIKSEFLTNVASGVSTNNIPLWNGSQFANSPLLYASPNLRTNGWFNFQGNRIYGDDSTALYYDSNNSSATQMVFRDNESTRYGGVYGSSDGTYFGLIDGDTDWSYMAQKDTLTQLRINNSVVAQFSPSSTLIGPGQMEVGGSLGQTGNRYSYTDYIGDDTYTDYGLRVLRGNTGPNTDSYLEHRGVGSFIMQATDAGTLRFRTNGADRMIINPTTGNVGIAQAPSATDKLAVTGNIAATGDLKAARLCNAAGASCVSLPLAASSIDGGGSANLVARFSDADTLSTGVIKDDGTNVGIGLGAGSPAQKLDVAGVTRVGTVAGNYIQFEPQPGFHRVAFNQLRFWDWDTGGDMVTFENGNVGVGTSPVGSAKLSLNGALRFTSNSSAADIYTGIGAVGTDIVGIVTAGVERLRIDTNYWSVRTGNGQIFRNNSNSTLGYVYHDGASSFGLLASDGGRNFRTWAGGNSELYGIASANDFRPYIIYDRNDTSYYVDPASTSRLNVAYSAIMYDTNDGNYYMDPNSTSNVWRLDRQRGYGQVEYDINDTNYYVDPNGTSAYNDLRSNIMYDRQDTSYYVDPNSSTRLLNVYPKLIQPLGVGGDSGQGDPGYGIYQEAGAWVHPYPDLVVGWHTGIKIGGHYSYGGTRFYNDRPIGSAGGTEIFSVGNGDNYVRAAYGIIANGSGVKTSCVGNCF